MIFITGMWDCNNGRVATCVSPLLVPYQLPQLVYCAGAATATGGILYYNVRVFYRIGTTSEALQSTARLLIAVLRPVRIKPIRGWADKSLLYDWRRAGFCFFNSWKTAIKTQAVGSFSRLLESLFKYSIWARLDGDVTFNFCSYSITVNNGLSNLRASFTSI